MKARLKHNPRSREPSSAFMLYMKDANLQASYWLIFRNYLGPYRNYFSYRKIIFPLGIIFPHTFKYLVVNALFLA